MLARRRCETLADGTVQYLNLARVTVPDYGVMNWVINLPAEVPPYLLNLVFFVYSAGIVPPVLKSKFRYLKYLGT